MNRTRTVVLATLASSSLALTACTAGGAAQAAPAVIPSSGPQESITVGSANFAENVLLAEVYAQALEAKGVRVKRKLDVGTREELIPKLRDGQIDLIPEYSGALLTYFDPDTKDTTSAEVYRDLGRALPSGLQVLEQSQAEDKDAIVVTEATADKYDLFSIGDLRAAAPHLTLGGPEEWLDRPTGLKGLKRFYGLRFGKYNVLDAGGPLTIDALKSGKVDAADVFTTDPNIRVEKWVVLPDPNSLYAAQNVLPLIREKKTSDLVQNALYEVSTKLTTDSLIGMMVQVTMKDEKPAKVAGEFLAATGLK